MSIATVVTRGYGSFGTIADVARRGFGAGAVAVAEEQRGGGRDRRRRKVIRYSDFETREEYENALRIAAAPILEAPIPMSQIPMDEDENEETESIFKLLMLMHDE